MGKWTQLWLAKLKGENYKVKHQLTVLLCSDLSISVRWQEAVKEHAKYLSFSKLPWPVQPQQGVSDLKQVLLACLQSMEVLLFLLQNILVLAPPDQSC